MSATAAAPTASESIHPSSLQPAQPVLASDADGGSLHPAAVSGSEQKQAEVAEHKDSGKPVKEKLETLAAAAAPSLPKFLRDKIPGEKEKELEREQAKERGEVAAVDQKPQPTLAEAVKDLQPEVEAALKKNENKIKGFFGRFK